MTRFAQKKFEEGATNIVVDVINKLENRKIAFLRSGHDKSGDTDVIYSENNSVIGIEVCEIHGTLSYKGKEILLRNVRDDENPVIKDQQIRKDHARVLLEKCNHRYNQQVAWLVSVNRFPPLNAADFEIFFVREHKYNSDNLKRYFYIFDAQTNNEFGVHEVVEQQGKNQLKFLGKASLHKNNI